VAAVQHTFTHKQYTGGHPVAAIQHTFTHKQYTEYSGRNLHNNFNGKLEVIWEVLARPLFASYTLAFALHLRKKHGKPSVKIVFGAM
jgi:hypothetical protein